MRFEIIATAIPPTDCSENWSLLYLRYNFSLPTQTENSKIYKYNNYEHITKNSNYNDFKMTTYG
ncbi:MAG: hypothetical protein DRR16_05830 [Candidatus Parabeggiatoa sp. nov. 3]|nr:MAG: hypothetical protein DRR00_11365 [Gammaproteobacteria bacterium]RKZ55043.1 MAG: hypothetical protein DRQ99_30515 [Gammaproteobacteria bacterium]RKZ88050.1 MAG: hypothetical protein DRR16_05830 [Gammaproteobacteria bacterium]